MARESLNALADTPSASAFPKRFGVVFLGNGINEDHWSAEGQGAEMKLGKTLEPLEPLKSKINVIDGLFVKALTGQGIHPGQTGSLLSGAHISKGAVIHSGISVDQMIANRDRRRHAAIEYCSGLRTADDGLPRDRTSRWRTARTSRGRVRTLRCRSKFIRLSPGTTCSTTAAAC